MSKAYLRVRALLLGACYVVDGLLMMLTLGELNYSLAFWFVASDTQLWLIKRTVRPTNWTCKHK